MKDEEIKRMLQAAGIPSNALGTTLARENYRLVKEWAAITARSGGGVGIVTYPKKGKHLSSTIGATELLHYLTAKELSLLGMSVCCCDLLDLHSAWVRQDENSEVFMKLVSTKIDVLCVRNFIEDCPPILPLYDFHSMASRFTTLNRKGITLVLMSLPGEGGIASWWPPSFTAYIERVGVELVAHL